MTYQIKMRNSQLKLLNLVYCRNTLCQEREEKKIKFFKCDVKKSSSISQTFPILILTLFSIIAYYKKFDKLEFVTFPMSKCE